MKNRLLVNSVSLLTSVAALIGADTSVQAQDKKPNIQNYVDIVLNYGADGGNNYRLRMPANAPVTQSWSVIVYESGNAMAGQRGPKVGDVSSRGPGIVKNADGSVDVYVAPTAPKGFENNWVQTKPDVAWFAVLRLYGPTKKADSWRLPDFQTVK